MEKDELKKMIQTTKDEATLAALWELYELKFCIPTLAARDTSAVIPCRPWNEFVYKGTTITTATL